MIASFLLTLVVKDSDNTGLVGVGCPLLSWRKERQRATRTKLRAIPFKGSLSKEIQLKKSTWCQK